MMEQKPTVTISIAYPGKEPHQFTGELIRCTINNDLINTGAINNICTYEPSGKMTFQIELMKEKKERTFRKAETITEDTIEPPQKLTKEQVLEFIKDHPGSTFEQLKSNFASYSESTISRRIKAMHKDGTLTYRGMGSFEHPRKWFIKDKRTKNSNKHNA